MSKKSDQKHEEVEEKVQGEQTHPEPEEKTDQVEELTNRVAALGDQLKRAVADYHNLEKRTRDDALTIVAYARTELILKLLPVLDNLEQSITGADEEGSVWFKGVQMSVKQLKQVLSEEGVEEITEISEFNPSLHDAIDTGEGEDGKILKVLQKGYKLNGKVIRPVKVVVGKKGEKENG